MDAISDYLAMGGFAAYVWPAYVITVGAMVGMIVVTLRDLRRDRKALAELEAQNPMRNARRAARATQTTGIAGPEGDDRIDP